MGEELQEDYSSGRNDVVGYSEFGLARRKIGWIHPLCAPVHGNSVKLFA